LANGAPDTYEGLRFTATQALHTIVVKRDFKKQYLVLCVCGSRSRVPHQFYGVPCPWLQCKILRYHRFYATPGDDSTSMLDEVLAAIYAESRENANEETKGVNYRNARQAVFQVGVCCVLWYDVYDARCRMTHTVRAGGGGARRAAARPARPRATGERGGGVCLSRVRVTDRSPITHRPSRFSAVS
jgi:hypothetical protein